MIKAAARREMKAFGSDLIKRPASFSFFFSLFDKHQSEGGGGGGLEKRKTHPFVIPAAPPHPPLPFFLPSHFLPEDDQGVVKDVSSACLQAARAPDIRILARFSELSLQAMHILGWGVGGALKKPAVTDGDLFQ